MARHYLKNPAESITDKLLAEARERADDAAARMREIEHADPSRDTWPAEYEAASAAARATARRVEGLERLRAAQVERTGQRAKTAKESAKELDSMAAGLSASRDQVAAAAAAHLRTLAAVAAAVESHNGLLAQSRARLAELGLRVRDDLVDVDAGEEHAEGLLEQGVRVGGVDWTPIPEGGVEAHALRAVFGGFNPMHPLAQIGKYTWRSFEVEARADGLKVPDLKDVSAAAAQAPPSVVMPERPSIRDLMATQDDLERIAEERHRAKVSEHRARVLARGGGRAAR